MKVEEFMDILHIPSPYELSNGMVDKHTKSKKTLKMKDIDDMLSSYIGEKK